MNRRQFVASTVVAGFAAAARAAEDGRKLRVAVIGHTGRGDYGHGLDTMWLNVPETEIVAAADPAADGPSAGLAAALKRLDITQGFADYRRMLTVAKPDIVAIGMRHIDQHRDVALAAAEAGVRGIYMEKPFCRTPGEADEIVAACRRYNVKLALAHRNRYHPVLPVVAGLVEQDRIGRLLEVRARGKEDARGGSLDLWVLGSHLMNMIGYFCGAPLACCATVLKDGRPVTAGDVVAGAEGVGPLAGNEVHARFETERGVPAFFDSLQNAGNAAAGFGLQLIGAQGIIDLRIDQGVLAHLVPGSPFRPTSQPRPWLAVSTAGVDQPEPIADLGRQVSGHLLAARDLIAAIRDDRPPLCSAEDGRQTVEMITAVFQSHCRHGRRVTFPLSDRGNPLARPSW